MLSKAKFSKKNYFFAAILHSLSVNFSNLRPFLSITFCQGFWISKMFGHLISGTGGKRHKNSTSKSKQTDRRTYHMWIPLLNHYRPWRQISTDQQKIQKTRQICKKKQNKKTRQICRIVWEKLDLASLVDSLFTTLSCTWKSKYMVHLLWLHFLSPHRRVLNIRTSSAFCLPVQWCRVPVFCPLSVLAPGTE